MKSLFKSSFEMVMNFSARANSWKFLSIVSFAESIFFPIPVDVFLAPMVLANRSKAIFLVFIAVSFSVLGGIVGYIIGFYFWDFFAVKLETFVPNFQEEFLNFREQFSEVGWILIIVGGFTPLPFKIVTVSAGILALNIYMFILCSIISRGARFALVGLLFYKYGEKIKSTLENYINQISIILIIIFLLYFSYKF